VKMFSASVLTQFAGQCASSAEATAGRPSRRIGHKLLSLRPVGWARGGERRMPLARTAKRLKTLRSAMGSYWKKSAWIWVWRHSRLGLAPRPFGVGAAGALARLELFKATTNGLIDLRRAFMQLSP
jgi:hypothetical protein